MAALDARAQQSSRDVAAHPSLLIVDDEPVIRDGCRDFAESLGFSCVVADKAEAAYAAMERGRIDVVLLDLKLPRITGLQVLQEIRRRHPEVLVIVITGYATVQSAVEAMKFGAVDYVAKPFGLEELRAVLDEAVERLHHRFDNFVVRTSSALGQGFGSMVGTSPEVEKLYSLITKAANSTQPVLLQGETGTGKELVARCIHASGSRCKEPFLAIDCGAIVPTLIESDLFGHVRGAFTDAGRSRVGVLQAAEGGTVFLDEIGELPMELQAKLLRTLQEKEIRPVGSTRPIAINVRILAAANRDLEAAVQRGTFRKDLFYRLDVLRLRIPSLRERKQDIPLLVAHFLERISLSSGAHFEPTRKALDLLVAHDWPGNVRELENYIERACALSSGPVIHDYDLPARLQKPPCSPGLAITPPKVVPFAELEKEAILNTIMQLDGDKVLAARMLGIGKTTLYRKLKEYHISDTPLAT